MNIYQSDPKVACSSTADPNSFAYVACTKRWPDIIRDAADDIEQGGERRGDAEAKKIAGRIRDLAHDLETDAPIEPFEHGLSGVTEYNDELGRLGCVSWLNCKWLFAECYIYRYIACLFAESTHWKGYDVFENAKRGAFTSSSKAVDELATRFMELREELHSKEGNEQQKKLLFVEILEICLWGNATDLSLLGTLDMAQLANRQGRQAIKESQKNIIDNDIDALWKDVATFNHKRVDIILDNAGFELFADLLFASFLIESGMASTVVLHPKDFGWFVSDVTMNDIKGLLGQMKDMNVDKITKLAEYWEGLFASRQFETFEHSFWTTAHPYCRMPYAAPDLLKELQKSDLVVFKGDLNYRKLTGDVHWPSTTPFQAAICPLSQQGLRVLTLRTNKADVCVGLEPGMEERLNKEAGGPAWRRSGKYAVISYCN